ncbi:MAG: hypothetical protein R3A12_09875 [Ignavibacteria bacterium]
MQGTAAARMQIIQHAIGGNDTLTISNVIIQNNVGGSGFYANGPINTVTAG